MSLHVHLIRPAETEWSLSGQHTSSTEIVLTAHGEGQARSFGERLRSVAFARVLTSPRQRAQQTYALSGLKPAVEIEPDLAEWDYGDYEGQRTVDIRKQRSDWNLFRDGCPNGEMPTQVCERADRFIVRLRALTGNTALFTHGQFGSVLVARWIELPVINFVALAETHAFQDHHDGQESRMTLDQSFALAVAVVRDLAMAWLSPKPTSARCQRRSI